MSESTIAGGGSTVAGGNSVAGGATLAAAAATTAGGGNTVAGGGSTVAGGTHTALNATTVTGASNTTAAWRDDWRQAFATVDGVVDPKLLRQVERYQTPEDFARGAFSLRTRMDSGDYVAKLPADAKPEEIAAWRAQNGIPEKAEGYLAKLPDTIKIPESDKANIGKFLESMHGQNATPAVTAAALDAYYKIAADTAATRAEADHTVERQATDTLNVEWGPDFRGNMNAIQGLLDRAPEGARGVALARMPDGSPVMSNVDVLRWLGTLAREINPAASIIPGAGGNAGKGVDDRIAEIEGVMAKTPNAYFKGAAGEKMQGEYRTLIEARERMKPRT